MHPDNLKKKLIDLFAANSTAEVEANSGAMMKDALGSTRYRQLVEDETFNNYYSTIKELRDKLDFAVEGMEKPEQVKECLHLLKKTKDESPGEKLELLSQLIAQGLYNNHWTPKECEYYDKGREMLVKWKDYFLSYTNRNRNETNNNFKEILNDVFGETDFNKNREDVNCVARLIAHYLSINNLTAFFDQDNMKCGDAIEDEVYKHCKSVYAFVQLVEPAIFQVQTGKKDGDGQQENWCRLEFQTYDEWSTENHPGDFKRYYFIRTEENVFPANFPKPYEDWKTKITAHLNIPDLGSLNKKEIRAKVREIATEIVNTRDGMFEYYIEQLPMVNG